MRIEGLRTVETPIFVESEKVGYTTKQQPVAGISGASSRDTISEAASENRLDSTSSLARAVSFSTSKTSGISQTDLSQQINKGRSSLEGTLIQALVAHHYNFIRV